MKRMGLILIVALLGVILTGCTVNSLEDYKEAVQKNEEIKRGQVSGEFFLTMDFDTTGLSEKEIKEMEYLKDIKGSINATYDDDAKKFISRNYINLNGLGFDSDIYQNGDEIFIKMPIAGKYLSLNEMINSWEEEQNGQGEGDILSEDTINNIKKTWLDLIKQEDVFTGKNIILTTPDGEVKTTQYSIKMTPDQINALVKDTINILSQDEKLKNRMASYLKNKNPQKEKEITFDQIFSNIKKSMASCQGESFKYLAYVDIDGYIVNEIMEFTIRFPEFQPGCITDFSYKLETKNWNINKEQHFEFPVLTEENTLKSDQLDQNMPFVFEDMFKVKNEEGVSNDTNQS